jgi:hypothetical protein
MITNTFELLSDTRDKINSTLSVNAKRDFWLAEPTSPPSMAAGTGSRRPAETAEAAAENGGRDTRKDHDMFNRRQISGPAPLAIEAAWAKTNNMGLPDAPTMDSRPTCKPIRSDLGSGLSARRYPERLDASASHEQRRQGIPPCRRAGRTRMADGMTAYLWGYNGQSPGPTIEAVEGDRVRIFVTNKLPEHTTIHWHGMILPSAWMASAGCRSRISRSARPSSTSSIS